ncbi:hypothetical protein HYD86_03010 [Mycoplasmopsis bovis]|nr:hypothetical protein [Mycoplasmopsis bovis]QQH36920.1 hypothetical protein HYD86_03010 [Mycoplasmopsis bovis]
MAMNVLEKDLKEIEPDLIDDSIETIILKINLLLTHWDHGSQILFKELLFS